MTSFNISDHPHRRFNALTGEWILVSPHRAKRPWQGQVEKLPQSAMPSYDEKCYLCPGNTRISGDVNPKYEQNYVFTNAFAALTLSFKPPCSVIAQRIYPISSKSDISFLIVAELRLRSVYFEIVLEPTGSPVSR